MWNRSTPDGRRVLRFACERAVVQGCRIEQFLIRPTRQVRYQQNYREEWQLGDITYDLDTWLDLPTFIEIEGPSEEAVRKAVAALGFGYEQARYGSIDLIYKSELNRDILAELTMLFAK